MNQIIPAILAKDEDDFRAKLALMDGLAPVLQIDVMDGAFVPNTSWFEPEVLRNLKCRSRFELHLMVENPDEVVNRCIGINSIIRILWHVEAKTDHAALLKLVHSKAWQAGLCINPDTAEETLEPLIPTLEEIQIMGNAPGFSGKTLDPKMIERAIHFHATWPYATLGFDIGVNAETVPQLANAGITRFAAASAIYGAENPKEAYKALASAGEYREPVEGETPVEEKKKRGRPRKNAEMSS